MEFIIILLREIIQNQKEKYEVFPPLSHIWNIEFYKKKHEIKKEALLE